MVFVAMATWQFEGAVFILAAQASNIQINFGAHCTVDLAVYLF